MVFDRIKAKDLSLKESICLFDNWEDRALYVMSYDSSFRDWRIADKKNQIQGCTNKAYLIRQQSNEFLFFSEAKIPNGILAMLSELYSFEKGKIVKSYQPEFVKELTDVYDAKRMQSLINQFKELAK